MLQLWNTISSRVLSNSTPTTMPSKHIDSMRRCAVLISRMARVSYIRTLSRTPEAEQKVTRFFALLPGMDPVMLNCEYVPLSIKI